MALFLGAFTAFNMYMYSAKGQPIPEQLDEEGYIHQSSEEEFNQGRESSSSWNSQLCLLAAVTLAIFIWVCLENREFEGRVEGMQVQMTRMNVDLAQLRKSQLEFDLKVSQDENQQQVENEEVVQRLSQFEEKGGIQMSRVQQQIIRVISTLNKLSGASTSEKAIIPKVLWFYTEHRLAAERMVEQFFGLNNLKIAEASQLEIRVVTSNDAYKWLSKDTTRRIATTMQTRKIGVEVSHLLRLALLMEHGGVMIKMDKLLLVNNLDWVFNTAKKTYSHEVILFSERTPAVDMPEYQDYFIAAVKQAMLITDAFNMMCWTISTGKIQFRQVRQAVQTNSEMNSTFITDISRTTLTAFLESMTPSFYNVKVIMINLKTRLSSNCQENLFQALKSDRQGYANLCGTAPFFIHHFNRSQLELEIEKTMDSPVAEVQAINPDSYWHQMLDLDSNRRQFMSRPLREVNYCILDAEPASDLQQIQLSMTRLKQQTTLAWLAVYFITKDYPELSQYASQQNKEGQKVKFVIEGHSLGQNYEKGIIKYCPPKSVVVILKRKEQFQSETALEELAQKVGKQGVLGAFISVNVSGSVRQPEQTFANYSRVDFNGQHPKYNQLATVLNMLRVFHSDCYKIIPQFDLRTNEGIYFNSRLAFLQQFLFMVRSLPEVPQVEKESKERVKWFIRSSSKLFDVPDQIVLMKDIVVGSSEWEEVDKNELVISRSKEDSSGMAETVENMVRLGQTMEKLAVFNPGNQNQPYTQRIRSEVIPRVVHQIWVEEGPLPQHIAKIIEINQNLNPAFIFKLWTRENITLKGFPRSYELLNNLMAADTYTRYSRKQAMVNVMMPELMYNEGGFYLDTSMMLFNGVLNQWLSYDLVIASEATFRHRWAQSLSFLGVVPGYSGLLRIIEHNNTNHYDIFSQNVESFGFQQLVQGIQEYRSEILMLARDVFNPLAAGLGRGQSYCLTSGSRLSAGEEVALYYKEQVMVASCGKYYPGSCGKQIPNLHSSWILPKW